MDKLIFNFNPYGVAHGNSSNIRYNSISLQNAVNIYGLASYCLFLSNIKSLTSVNSEQTVLLQFVNK